LLRFESSYRAILSLRHHITRTPDRDTHLPALGWNNELLFFGASPDRDSSEEYPEIRGSIYLNPPVEDRRINMVAPTGAPSQNSSSRYPTIRGFVASEAQTPSNRLVWNLNPDINHHAAPDYHGVNSVHGALRLSSHYIGPARG
jgi:hypothetical protein